MVFDEDNSDDEILSAGNSNTNRYGTTSYTYTDDVTSVQKAVIIKERNRSRRIIRSKDQAIIFQCSFCYYQSPYRYNLKSHAKYCHQSRSKKVWECSKCKVKFLLEDLLSKHRLPAAVDSLGDSLFYCPVCSLSGHEESEAIKLERYHPSNGKPMICPCCQGKVKGYSSLKKHLVDKHDVKVMYRCEYCDYSSASCDNVREHKKCHSDLQELGLIQCSHCRLEFLTISEFKDHMRKVQWEKERQPAMGFIKDEEDAEKNKEETKKNIESDEEKPNVHDVDMGNSADIGKWQLQCTLCQYVNYSKTSCERHVKNKHRPYGDVVVRFDKYCENQLKGSMNIGKVKGERDLVLGEKDLNLSKKDNEQTSTQELLRILDWTQSDGEDTPEVIADQKAGPSEVITIEMTSDIEDENQDNMEEVKGSSSNSKGETTVSDSTEVKGTVNCSECLYQTNNNANFVIHQQLLHEGFGEKYIFKCPMKPCKYKGSNRVLFRNHVRKTHKLNANIFYPKELKCPHCLYTARKPHHLFLHTHNAHKGQLGRTLNKPIVAAPGKKGRENRGDIHEVRKGEETNVKSNKLGCNYCRFKCEGTYMLAWHAFKSHGFNSEIQKWRLKCKLCSYESYSKVKCQKHGRQHNVPYVRYQKFYNGTFKGSVGFRYPETEQCSDNSLKSKFDDNPKETRGVSVKLEDQASSSGKVLAKPKENSNNPKIKHEKQIAASRHLPVTRSRALKILDQSHSDDKNDDAGEIKDRDKNANLSNDAQCKGKQEKLESDDNLLQKRAEFFTCPQCNYETKEESYISLHEQLVHGDRISSDKNKYRCKDCDFVSKYRHSLKRHLRSHNYNVDELYTTQQANEASQPKNKNKNDKTSSGQEQEQEQELVCQACGYEYDDKYQLDWHMFQVHRIENEIKKWNIRCILCNYQTHSKKYARCHARSKHISVTEPTKVLFDKYYNNQFHGRFKFKIEKGSVHCCTKCNFVTTTLDNLRRHYMTHKMQIVKKNKGNEIDNNPATSVKQEKVERNEIDINPATSVKREKEVEPVEDKESSKKDPKSSDKRKGDGLIQMAADGDEESYEDQDISQNDDELKQNDALPEPNRHSNKHLRKRSKRFKADVHDEATVASQYDDNVKESTNLSHNNELNEEQIGLSGQSKSVKRSSRLRTEKLPDNKINDEDPSENNDDTVNRHITEYLEDSDRHKSSNTEMDFDNGEGNDSEEYMPSDDEKKDEEFRNSNRSSISYKRIMLPDVKYVTNKCIHRGCTYKSSDKWHFKSHCEKVHRDSKKKLDRVFMTLKQYECRLCKFQSNFRKGMIIHMTTRHKMKSDESVSTCPTCKIVYKSKYHYASHMFKIHSDNTELRKWRLRCKLCSYETPWKVNARKHAVARHASFKELVEVDFEQFYEDKFEGVYTYPCEPRTSHHCTMCDFVTGTWECLSKHVARHSKVDFVPLYKKMEQSKGVRRSKKKLNKETVAGRADVKTKSYSKEQVLDIIGITSLEIKNNKDNEGNNEVITIEITDDNIALESENNSKTILNPFTGELITENIDEEQPEFSKETSPSKPKSSQGGNVGSRTINFTCHLCKEVLTSRNSLQTHTNAHAIETNKLDLVVTFSEHRSNNFVCDIEIKANPGIKTDSKDVVPKQPSKISYKCWMCGSVVVTKITLKNHTNIHAREDENYNLKVRFSQFSDDKLVGTIVMHADPNYVSRQKKQANSPEPEYDPTMTVYSCDECNYKSNMTDELKKHKDLHWTPEKEALFKAQKWFTCSVCFFHCFDVKKFNEHCEWHKTHFTLHTTPGGIRKMGKDSWFLK